MTVKSVIAVSALVLGLGACASLTEEDRAYLADVKRSSAASADSASRSAADADAAARRAEAAAARAEDAAARAEAIFNRTLRK